MDYGRALDEILSSAKRPEDDYYFILGCVESSSVSSIVFLVALRNEYFGVGLVYQLIDFTINLASNQN